MSMGITIFNNAVGGGGGSAPSGVLFKTIEPSQYTSYRTGDEGWQVQNGLFNYTPPTNPAAVAELDYTVPNYYQTLKTPLVVNGNSNTFRFVDVDGLQNWSAVNNKQFVTIDKLTGRMYTRALPAANGLTWNQFIDNARVYSITVNGVVYTNWFGAGLGTWNSFQFFQNMTAGGIFNPSSVLLIGSATTNTFTSTTRVANILNAISITTFGTNLNLAEQNKTSILGGVWVRNAQNLITAP